MLDSDLAGFEEGVVKLLEAEKPVQRVDVQLANRSIGIGIARAAGVGVPPGALSEFGGVPILTTTVHST